MQVERDGEMRHLFDFDAAVRIVFESLQATLYATWPDIIVVVSGHFFSAPLFDMIRANRPHKLVMLHTESPYEDERQIELAQHFDVNVLNDPINIDRFPAGTIYIPHAYDPRSITPTVGPRSSTSASSAPGTGRGSTTSRRSTSGLRVWRSQATGRRWTTTHPSWPTRWASATSVSTTPTPPTCTAARRCRRTSTESKPTPLIWSKAGQWDPRGGAGGVRHVLCSRPSTRG